MRQTFADRMSKRLVLFLVVTFWVKLVTSVIILYPDLLPNSYSNLSRQDDFANPVNLEEVGGNFEGDIMLDTKQIRSLDFGPRNGLVLKQHRWTKRNGEVRVYYGIVSNQFSLEQRLEIRSALDEIEAYTCIKFIRKPRKNFISVFSGRGCFSSVGMVGGVQRLSLQRNGCVKRGIIMHEFLHALGFFHMQSSHNRDKYVRIKPENIRPAQIHNFNKYSTRFISHFGTSYDLDSIMHYSKKAFSRNGRDTIETIDPDFRDRIGQRGHLSLGDVQRINNMYNC